MTWKAISVFVALALAACSKPPAEPFASVPLKVVPSAAVQTELQNLTDEACRCERAGGSKASCSATFKARTRIYGPAEESAAGVFPVTPMNTCFGDTSQPTTGFCVSRFDFVLNSKLRLCSADEACAVAALYSKLNAGLTPNERQVKSDQINAAMLDLANRFARGERAPKAGDCPI